MKNIWDMTNFVGSVNIIDCLIRSAPWEFQHESCISYTACTVFAFFRRLQAKLWSIRRNIQTGFGNDVGIKYSVFGKFSTAILDGKEFEIIPSRRPGFSRFRVWLRVWTVNRHNVYAVYRQCILRVSVFSGWFAMNLAVKHFWSGTLATSGLIYIL